MRTIEEWKKDEIYVRNFRSVMFHYQTNTHKHTRMSGILAFDSLSNSTIPYKSAIKKWENKNEGQVSWLINNLDNKKIIAENSATQSSSSIFFFLIGFAEQ